MQIKESAEDYLEAILILSESHDFVRAIDICNFLEFSRPSVSIALKKFKDAGLVQIDEKKHISLTPTGLEIANKMLERHKTFTQMFMNLGVPEEIAKTDACRIEHYLSNETYEAIRKHFSSHQEG